MQFLDFITRFFRRDTASSQSARNRLQLVLIHDRAQVCPEIMEALRNDMIQLISRYMVIDEVGMSVALERKEGTVALAASIPVINIRRTQPAVEGGGRAATAVLEPPPAPSPKPSRPAEAATTPRVDPRTARILKRKRDAVRRKRTG